MPRHDPQRTNRQEASGNVRTPAVLWSINLGSHFGARDWIASDTNGDGQTEVVLIRGGRLVARHVDGTLVWATDLLGFTDVRAVHDFDRDGRREVFAGAAELGLFVIDSTTGDVLWRTPYDPASRLGTVFPVDVNGDGREELYVADDGCSMGGAGTGRVYSFPAPWTAPDVTTLNTADHGYWCGRWQSAGDVDGDGALEIVTLAHQQVVLYDPATGEPTARTADLGEFPYGLAVATVADVDGDGRDEIVLASNRGGERFSSARRLLLVEMEGGDLVLRWQMPVDPLRGRHSFPTPAAADVFDAPGLEIATSLYDPDASRWEVRVFRGDSATATPALAVPNEALLALQDVDGDGFADLLTVEATGPNVPAFGRLRARRVTGSPSIHTDTLWMLDNASLPLHSTRWDQIQEPTLLHSGTAAPPRVLVAIDGDGDGRADRAAAIAAGADPSSYWGFTSAATSTSARPVEDEPDRVIMTFTDGSVAQLDGTLALQNDADGDGMGDLVETSYRPPTLALGSAGSHRLLVTNDGALRPVAFSTEATSAGTTPPLLWSTADSVTPLVGPQIVVPADSPPVVALVAERGSGALDLLFLDAVRGDGAGGARVSEDNTEFPFNDLVPLRTVAGRTDLIISLRSRLTDRGSYRRVRVPTGEIADMGLSRVLTGGGDGPSRTSSSTRTARPR